MKDSLGHKIKTKLTNRGVDFSYFVDISHLSDEQNKGYPRAVLFGILLSPAYLLNFSETPDYVMKMKRDKLTNEDEFNIKELKTDSLADYIADHLASLGYSAYSQSEKNISLTGFFDEGNKSTPLPHKTIAGLAGLGWIGKNNLLVSPEFGCAISMCSVLTDAPLETISCSYVPSKCGDCKICENICEVKALKGKSWRYGVSRDEIIDVTLCNTCLQCMIFCPWTQKYMKEALYEKRQNHIAIQSTFGY